MVIPTYRRPAGLRGALAALAAADPAPSEVVVSAFESADAEMAEEAEKAEEAGARVVISPRRGAAAQRNAGWRAARGRVIAFTDDDCVPDRGWLGALTAPFQDAAVGLVQGATLPAGPTDPLTRSVHVTVETGLYESCNIAYRRAALEDSGGFDETLAERFSGRPFGEDVQLAWRVKRAGWRSDFSADAVVRHEVTRTGLSGLVAEEWRRGMFPALVAEVPELRDHLPGGGWLLRPQSAWAQLAVAGAAAALASPAAGAALAAPYALWLARSRDLREVPYQALRDAVASVALLIGSARARSVLL